MPHLFALSTLNSKVRLVFARFIVAAVADTNGMKLITSRGKIFRVEGTLEHALEWMIACGEEAVRAHNSYIINLRYVAEMEDEVIFFDSEVINSMNEELQELIKQINFSRSGKKNLLSLAADLSKPLPPKPKPEEPVCSVCRQKIDETGNPAPAQNQPTPGTTG